MNGFEQSEGATPLSDEDMNGLKLSWVTTQGDLNHAEADNVLVGRGWATGRRRQPKFWFLDGVQLHAIHKRMFGQVWKWAGQTRRTQTNIGCAPPEIAIRLVDLRANVLAQIGNGTAMAYEPVELAVRYHHALVSIHPYRNGNGRHARLAADLLAAALGCEMFSWGGSDVRLESVSDIRTEYPTALRQADADMDFGPLIDFATR